MTEEEIEQAKKTTLFSAKVVVGECPVCHCAVIRGGFEAHMRTEHSDE